eukprot:768513-Hanusia_phi.AAC.1
MVKQQLASGSVLAGSRCKLGLHRLQEKNCFAWIDMITSWADLTTGQRRPGGLQGLARRRFFGEALGIRSVRRLMARQGELKGKEQRATHCQSASLSQWAGPVRSDPSDHSGRAYAVNVEEQ